MTSRIDPELVLFMDSCTGDIVIEGISCDYERAVAKPDHMRMFRTGLVYEESVAAKIRRALNKRGVKVKGVPEKCINISKDWLVQILAILYYGLDPKALDRMAYLINAANHNSEWKNNPGIELQKLKEKEYRNKVEQFDRAKRAKISPAKQPPIKRKDLKILIVEDDSVSSRLLRHYLSPLGECDIAGSGLDALKAYIKAIDCGEGYDLITLDIMLPEVNGHEVLKRIRTIEEERRLDSTKIIMTTALDEARVIMSAFKEQCDVYLVKPIRKEDLLKRLGELNLLDH